MNLSNLVNQAYSWITAGSVWSREMRRMCLDEISGTTSCIKLFQSWVHFAVTQQTSVTHEFIVRARHTCMRVRTLKSRDSEAWDNMIYWTDTIWQWATTDVCIFLVITLWSDKDLWNGRRQKTSWIPESVSMLITAHPALCNGHRGPIYAVWLPLRCRMIFRRLGVWAAKHADDSD